MCMLLSPASPYPAAQDTRSLDGKTNLAAWLARQLCTAQPPAPLLAEQLPHVVHPKLRVSLQETADTLGAVEAGLAGVVEELQRCGAPVTARLSVAEGGQPHVALDLQVDHYQVRAPPGGTWVPDYSMLKAAVAGAVSALARLGCMTPANRQTSRVETANCTLLRLQEVMGEVVATTRAQLGAVRQQLLAAHEAFAALAAHYGESAAALGSEQELWGDITAFVEQFTAAQKAALRQLREAEKVEARLSRTSSAPRPRRRPLDAAGAGGQGGSSDAVVGVHLAGPNGLAGAKKQLSFCSSSAVSSDGTALAEQQRRVEELLQDEASDS